MSIASLMLKLIRVAVAVVAITAAEAFAASTTYLLSNHPDGAVGPPTYGLRLDDLAGSGDFTFSFDDSGAEMTLVYDDVAETIVISGTVYGGKDTGSGYDTGMVGLWEVYFEYTANVLEDEGGLVVSPQDDANVGTIEFVSGAGWTPGDTYNLTDVQGTHDHSFKFVPDGHRLSGDDSTLVGRGWVNHDGDGDIDTHNYASDWLFVGTEDISTSPDTIIPEPVSAFVWLGLMGVGNLRRRR